MFLPFALLLSLHNPAHDQSAAEPVIFRIPSDEPDTPTAQFQICVDTVSEVMIGEPGPSGEIGIFITLDEIGGTHLAQATSSNVGRRAEVLQGEEVLISPVINEPILGGRLAISGIETIARAEQLRQAVLGRCTVAKDETE